MTSVETLLAAIRTGPEGPGIGAFFDFDGTIIEGYSARALYARRLRDFEVGPDEVLQIALATTRGPLDEDGFGALLETGIRRWTGRTEDELLALGKELFTDEIAGALFHGAWQLVRAHLNQGHTVVIATSATRLQVQPMARELGVEHVLCTELEQEGGVLTGRVAGRAPWGDGKRAAVVTFAAEHHIDFGTPIPLRERLQSLRVDGVEDGREVERVALEVCHHLNRATPVTATAAVCGAMLGSDRALTLDEVCATVAPLARYLGRRGWPVAAAADLTDRSTVRRTLQDLVSSSVLTAYAGGPERVWGVGPDQHLVAAAYRNSAVHVLLERAIAELVLLSIARENDGSLDLAWEEALRLRELLKFDFFFAGRAEFAEELWNEVAILAGGPRPAEISPTEAETWLTEAAPLVAHLVLRPYLDAYRVVAEQLVLVDDTPELDEDQFLEDCLGLARQWAMQRRIASDESVSAEMYRTALKMARHRGLLDPELDTPQRQTRRRELAVALDRALYSVEQIAVLAETGAPVHSRPLAVTVPGDAPTGGR